MPASTLSSSREDDYASNRISVVKILSNIRFLGRRGLPLRGDGDGNNSNSTQIFHEADAKRDAESIMALEVLRDVAPLLHSSPFYSVMADETRDSSNREQVVICFRWVDNSLNA